MGVRDPWHANQMFGLHHEHNGYTFASCMMLGRSPLDTGVTGLASLSITWHGWLVMSRELALPSLRISSINIFLEFFSQLSFFVHHSSPRGPLATHPRPFASPLI